MGNPKQQQWIQEFFGGPEDFYGTAYSGLGTFEKKDAVKEVEGVLKMLNPEPGSHLLDWCGGWGRHAIEFSRRGYRVTLLDITKQYLEQAAGMAEQEGVTLTCVHADFRETPKEIQADYAVNLFSAGLGYLSEEDDRRALNSLLCALKRGGKLIIDTMNLFWMIRNFQEYSWRESRDCTQRYLQHRTFDFWTNTEHSENTYESALLVYPLKRETHLHVYAPADLARVLRKAGFKPLEIFGDYDGSPFGLTSKRLIMTAVRP